jgi:voltage-gated potassium channel Kch
VLKHDVLHSIGAENASLIILTGGGAEVINQAVDRIQKDFPNLTIIARAEDRPHALHLIANDVPDVTRETFFSAVEMGKKTLKHLGFTEQHVEKMAQTYVRHDVDTLHQQVSNRHDEKALISIAKNAREQLEQTLQADKLESESHPEESES